MADILCSPTTFLSPQASLTDTVVHTEAVSKEWPIALSRMSFYLMVSQYWRLSYSVSLGDIIGYDSLGGIDKVCRLSHDSPLSLFEAPCQRLRSWANTRQPSLKQKQCLCVSRAGLGNVPTLYPPSSKHATQSAWTVAYHTLQLLTLSSNTITGIIFIREKEKSNLRLQHVLRMMIHSKNYGLFATEIWGSVTEFSV